MSSPYQDDPEGDPPLAEDLGGGDPRPLTGVTATNETASAQNFPQSVTDADQPAPFDLPFSSDQAGPTPYSDYRVDTREEQWEGVLPQINLNGDHGLFRVAEKPWAAKVGKWTAERRGAAPDIPDINTGDGNDVLSYRTVTACSPAYSANGVATYRASGVYVWREKAAVASGYEVPGIPAVNQPPGTITAYVGVWQ
jgi:hypothetical protein